MNKLEQAAWLALDVLENERCHVSANWDNVVKAITALREALDHSGEANEMVIGWDRVKPEAITSDPLYQQGFVDGVEEGCNQVAEQAEQSQLADATLEPMFFGLTQDHTWLSISEGQYEKVAPEGRMKVYAAPVRTKDLTDDEIWEIWFKDITLDWDERCRAVIEKFKEKNK